MPKDALDKETEQLIREETNPKIKQRMEVLEYDDNFLKDTADLQEKYAELLDEYDLRLDKIWQKLDEIIGNAGIWNKVKTGNFQAADFSDFTHLCTPKDLEEFGFLSQKAYEPLKNDEFNKDLIELCKKYSLFPIDYWRKPLQLFVATDNFFPPTNWFSIGLANHTPVKEMDDIFKVPPDLNFAIKIENNKNTNEPELFVQIFENTSARDLTDNWHIVAKQQKKLKGQKGVEKKFYPLKNLDKAKKIKELREQGKSDWEIQEEIYGEAGDLDFGKIENKRKGLIKQIRNFYKKIIG